MSMAAVRGFCMEAEESLSWFLNTATSTDRNFFRLCFLHRINNSYSRRNNPRTYQIAIPAIAARELLLPSAAATRSSTGGVSQIWELIWAKAIILKKLIKSKPHIQNRKLTEFKQIEKSHIQPKLTNIQLFKTGKNQNWITAEIAAGGRRNRDDKMRKVRGRNLKMGKVCNF